MSKELSGQEFARLNVKLHCAQFPIAELATHSFDLRAAAVLIKGLVVCAKMSQIAVPPKTRALHPCMPGVQNACSQPQRAAGGAARLAGWQQPDLWRQKRSGRTSLRAAASGGQDPFEEFKKFSVRSPLLESEIFGKELNE